MDQKTYFDKVYGCWLGKNVGGAMGMPFEGHAGFVNGPVKMPDSAVANDDLDLQLVWLDVLRRKGADITADDLAETWGRNIVYAWDEYGVAIANLKLGLKPPYSGIRGNWFKDCMGAPIRSEIWACIAPGRPEIAGWYAYQDASVDHWDEGVYGEIFLATVESAAFSVSPVVIPADGKRESISDHHLHSLINTGLSFLPGSSRVRQGVELAVLLYGDGRSLRESRDRIVEEFGHHNFTDAVQNIAFIALGLLYGQGDFVKTIESAIRCGCDGDCTGSSTGAIMGILSGRQSVLSRLDAEISDEIIMGDGITGLKAPATLAELTEQTVAIGEQVLAGRDRPVIAQPFVLPPVRAEEVPALRLPCCVSAPVATEVLADTEDRFVRQGLNGSRRMNLDSRSLDLAGFFGPEPDANVFVSTHFRLPDDRKLKVFPATTDGVKLWIDGDLVLSHRGRGKFLPAPHRPGSPLVELKMKKGWHRVLLELARSGNTNEFAWIVTDEKNHYVTDIEYRDTPDNEGGAS